MKESKIKRIAILGTESSHARAFAQLLQGHDKYRIIGAYGTEPDANRKFEELFGVDCSTSSPDAFCDEADGVLITARNGADHLALARPYLRPGTTVFVDKPICNTPEEAAELIALAQQNNARLCGGSCLKYAPALHRLRAGIQGNPLVGASFSAPVELESVYGGFLFYAPHLIEMALTVLDEYRIRSVRAIRQGDKVTALLRYDDFCVSLFFGCDAYTASVSCRTYGKHCEVKLNSIPSLYAKELAHFCKLLWAEEDVLPDFSRLADHVKVAAAIQQAYETGTEVSLS